MTGSNFTSVFKALTGNRPFPWQWELYDGWFSKGTFPRSCDIPTGLGKTSIVAIWLIALAQHQNKIPRRLVYVVNRRTVVDQTTDEVLKIRQSLAAPCLSELCTSLKKLCALELEDGQPPLALSTLRGQLADNREWSADPARPAVIVGTVDMIGSRLLFSGYGVGFKTKPLHAAFLGQDALLVHDEAHLEPAFQKLIQQIELEQHEREDVGELPWRKLRVLALTATARHDAANKTDVFRLTNAEQNPPPEVPDEPTSPLHVAWRRLKSRKALHLVPLEGEVADEISGLALSSKFKESRGAILVFVRSVRDAERIRAKLDNEGQRVTPLTGTIRGLERDLLIADPIFKRFMSRTQADDPNTVYLVCTSAGEVGVNISGDHLICDLTTFESMAQRFGRVNRFGDRADTEIHVVHPTEFDPADQYAQRQLHTLRLLMQLGQDASPSALALLDPEARQSAFAPEPVILTANDMLFDTWALTSINRPLVRDRLPGRADIEPYLHGIAEWEPPETHVAWRKEVSLIKSGLVEVYPPEALIEDYPVKPHELLRDISSRIFDGLKKVSERLAQTTTDEIPVWLVADDGSVEVTMVSQVIEAGKEELYHKTVLLPPAAGGLKNGMFDGDSRDADDVADRWKDERGRRRRDRDLWDNDRVPHGMRLIRTIDTRPGADEFEPEGTLAAPRFWHWCVLPRSADDDLSKTSNDEEVLWDDHTNQVTSNTERIVQALGLKGELQEAICTSARFHDLGKKRFVWQRSIGNPNPRTKCLAKSGPKMRPLEITRYRHEFGSLVDIEKEEGFCGYGDDFKDLCRHLIAAHHGRARPHFPESESFDPSARDCDPPEIAAMVPQRFARLQRKYGRWGLAYLESLLRAADYAASANPVPTKAPPRVALAPRNGVRGVTNPIAAIRVNVDLANPGQFFACCGLLELADRLWPGAEGWFESKSSGHRFSVACEGTLCDLLCLLVMDPPEKLTTLDNGLGVKPILTPLRLTFDGGASASLTLDAWMNVSVQKGKPGVFPNRPWNMWSGNQKPFDTIWQPLRLALVRQLPLLQADLEGLFDVRVPLTGRFGFDPGAAWNALDVGFSPNTQQMPVASSPATELLAAVGLQRFRPVLSQDRKKFRYATWGKPLEPSVATAACSGEILVRPAIRFWGRVVDRGQYAALAYSSPM